MSLDSQTLDLLTSSSIDVRLRRSVNFYFGVSKGNKKLTPTQTQTDDIEAAVWRPLPPMRASSSVQSMRQFEGEIHLPKDLQPTSDFSLLTIEVSLPVITSAFSYDTRSTPLCSSLSPSQASRHETASRRWPSLWISSRSVRLARGISNIYPAPREILA